MKFFELCVYGGLTAILIISSVFVLPVQSQQVEDPDFIGGLDFYIDKTQDFDENEFLKYPFFNYSISNTNSSFLFEWDRYNAKPPAFLLNFTIIIFTQVERYDYEIRADRTPDHYKVITDENKVNVSGFPSGYEFALAVFVDVFDYSSGYIFIDFEILKSSLIGFALFFFTTTLLGIVTYIFYKRAYPSKKITKEVLL